MSLAFVIILLIILAVDFLIALFGNVCPHAEGKDREKILRLLQRYAVIFGGYAAVGLIAYFCGRHYPSMEYIGGLLLDPIFRYSISLLDRLKTLMIRPKREECKAEKAEKADKAEEKAAEIPAKPEEKTSVKRVVPTKAAPVKKADPIMIEIEPAVKAPTEKPKAKPRARKATKA
ncbi:MAG: hypothetical protein IJU25_05990 [Lachnospiraceae bacterium]|nr:hypothetical protein [Lachnospiraceae bacterium]MCR5266967.1 hypothetical protein [Lachnospiraceae bacterium]